MNDRELLERAAKAAGIAVIRSRLGDPLNLDMLVEDSPRNEFQRSGPWNPLTDDGDALRLAVKLRLEIHIEPNFVRVWMQTGDCLDVGLDDGVDPAAATRRAIVRAAASMVDDQK